MKTECQMAESRWTVGWMEMEKKFHCRKEMFP